MDYNGINVLITGGSGGIGQAMGRAFGAQGYGVAVQGFVHMEPARAIAQEINAQGGRALALQGDISREEEVESLFSAAEEALGAIHVLINNAGISWRGLLTDMTLGEWEQVFAVNVRGAFLCCRRALPAMIREKSGAIINVSSMWGRCGASCEAAYSASKAALIGLTQALAQEEGPSGIRVNCLAPGVIGTPMNASLSPSDLQALAEDTPLQRIGSPEEVAAAALFLAQHPFITGQVLGVDGGFIL